MTYTRIDHSNDLIHFTKNAVKWDYSKSYKIFCQIISDGYLKESDTLRLGKIPSICFTEASYRALTKDGKLNEKYFKRYSPFGFMFSKKYIFIMGGRPAIYSPANEFEKKNSNTNWRTVTYYPVGEGENFRDYTWEREWRIKPHKGKLKLDLNEVKLVFPSKEWAEKFRDDHDAEHNLESCDCNCSRECKIISYDHYLTEEKNEIIEGTCDESIQFPWILINMNCTNIPVP